MKLSKQLIILILATLICNAQTMQEPRAKKIKKELTIHGDTRVDNYYWLNQRENPEVIDYLNKENAYTKEVLKGTEQLQADLFQEMKARIKQDDESVPYKLNGYWYINKYEKGKEYPIRVRKKESLDNKEELLFDVNEMAKPFKFYDLRGVSVSENNKIATFGVDTLSRRIYTIYFKDLETGEILPDKIENTTGGTTWANDNKTVFYTRKDETLRAFQIYKHKLGTDSKEDILVHEEKDPTFGCFVFKTKSRDYIVIGSYATVSNEYRLIKADEPDSEFKVFQPRERDLEYSFSHYKDNFYIVTNKDGATNFKLMKTPVNKTGKEHWVDVIPHREDVYLEGIEIFKDYLVIDERKKGNLNIKVQPWNGKNAYYIPFKEDTYTAYTAFNPEFDTQELRYGYSSLTTPWSTIDFNMQTKEQEVKKEQAVLGDFDKENYVTKRLWATARDGEKVAISLVYHKNTKPNADTPLLLYGYGSYGSTVDPYFSSIRLSLLNRGFVFAIAHIRGGQYLGRQWYDNGKLLKKKNTFYDFIDCAKYLINENYTSSAHLYANGGSAGGLLMGAVINYEPELFNGVIAGVPFVDVVTTMLDDSIPLTTGEYDEWGNPNEKEYYEYLKSYSPYDNIEEKKYPNMLVTTGLHDSQVQYWEPAKWVALLREKKKGDNLLLLHTNMDAGHGGSSGRFERIKEVALEYAFFLMLENIKS